MQRPWQSDTRSAIDMAAASIVRTIAVPRAAVRSVMPALATGTAGFIGYHLTFTTTLTERGALRS